MLNRIPRRQLLIYLLYLLVAVNLTSPIITSLSTQFLGGDNSDAYEMARHVWWFKTALQNGDDIFWQSNLGYPDGFSGVTLWANPLQFFPMWLFAFVMPLAMAYNVTILLTMALNGWAMYWLAWNRFDRSHHPPAFFTGLIYMIFPVFQGHLFDGHAGLMVQWAVPLLIYALFEYINSGERRWFGWSVLFFVLAPAGHMLQIVYLLLPLMTLFFLARLYKRDYNGVGRIVSVGVGGGILLLIYLLPVISDTLQTAQYTKAGGFVRYSLDLLGVASPSHLNPFWRDVLSYPERVLGINLAEGSSYIGILGGLLALVGLISKRASRWWLLVAVVAWVFALGPVLKVFDEPLIITVAGYETVVPLPHALFIDLPVFELARTPGRFMFLFAVAFAMIAGYGMTTLWNSDGLRQSNRVIRYGFLILLAVFIVGDYDFFEDFPTSPAEIPSAIRALSERDDIRAVFNAPYNNLVSVKEALYLQTAHEKALIAGQISRETPIDPAILALLQTFETPLLTDAGADIVIINKYRADQMGQLESIIEQARIHLGDPFYEDERYALFETPILSTEPEAVYTITPDVAQDVSYIYKEQPGWLEYTATLSADNRMVHMILNGERLHTLIIDGTKRLSVPLPIGRRGYNTFTIELDPPCPDAIGHEMLVCRDVTISEIDILPLTTGPIYDPIRMEDGIELASFFMPAEFEDILSIRLWWRFEQPRIPDDVRFVHVLDENRRLMAQADDSFGDIEANTEWTETIALDLSELPAGDYIVLTGWYALPDAIRYDVLTNVDGAQDNTIVLGTFSVSDD